MPETDVNCLPAVTGAFSVMPQLKKKKNVILRRPDLCGGRASGGNIIFIFVFSRLGLTSVRGQMLSVERVIGPPTLTPNTHRTLRAQELCESRGGRPGLSVLTSLLVSVDVKLY